MPVLIFPFSCHFGEGHSGWGWGAGYCNIIPSQHPDPCLLNNRRVEYEEGLHCGPRFGRQYAPVLLEPCLDCAVKSSGTMLVDPSARLSPGVDKTPGLR